MVGRLTIATPSSSSNSVIEGLLQVDSSIRYVALYMDGTLISRERAGLLNTSASESDKYEELIVNPTLLKLVQQRGNIDCGGVEYVLIRYGNFFQFVLSMQGGHISVGIEASGDVMKTISAISAYLQAERMVPKADKSPQG